MKPTHTRLAVHPIKSDNKAFGWSINTTNPKGDELTGRVCDVPRVVPNHTPDEQKAIVFRIEACVNACAGINPAAVPKMLEALRAVLSDWERIAGKTNQNMPSIAQARAALAKAKA